VSVTLFDRLDDDQCDACGARPDVLHASGEALSSLLCGACMAKAQAEHERRCCFCGVTASFPHRRRPFTWQDVAGRHVCDDDCAELERARQAAEPMPRPLVIDEIDAVWVVDQAAWAAERPRKELA
jgi:hypothetical protein